MRERIPVHGVLLQGQYYMRHLLKRFYRLQVSNLGEVNAINLQELISNLPTLTHSEKCGQALRCMFGMSTK